MDVARGSLSAVAAGAARRLCAGGRGRTPDAVRGRAWSRPRCSPRSTSTRAERRVAASGTPSARADANAKPPPIHHQFQAPSSPALWDGDWPESGLVVGEGARALGERVGRERRPRRAPEGPADTIGRRRGVRARRGRPRPRRALSLSRGGGSLSLSLSLGGGARRRRTGAGGRYARLRVGRRFARVPTLGRTVAVPRRAVARGARRRARRGVVRPLPRTQPSLGRRVSVSRRIGRATNGMPRAEVFPRRRRRTSFRKARRAFVGASTRDAPRRVAAPRPRATRTVNGSLLGRPGSAFIGGAAMDARESGVTTRSNRDRRPRGRPLRGRRSRRSRRRLRERARARASPGSVAAALRKKAAAVDRKNRDALRRASERSSAGKKPRA